MIHRVEKGGNYGWSAMEGPQPIKPDKVGPTPIRAALIELPHTIACSVTGGRVYRGQRFHWVDQGVVQFGDPLTRDMTKQQAWGTGGSGPGNTNRPIGVAEPSKKPFVRGRETTQDVVRRVTRPQGLDRWQPAPEWEQREGDEVREPGLNGKGGHDTPHAKRGARPPVIYYSARVSRRLDPRTLSRRRVKRTLGDRVS